VVGLFTDHNCLVVDKLDRNPARHQCPVKALSKARGIAASLPPKHAGKTLSYKLGQLTETSIFLALVPLDSTCRPSTIIFSCGAASAVLNIAAKVSPWLLQSEGDRRAS